MKIILLFFIGVLTAVQLRAQENIPIGTWRTHFSYYDTRHLADAGSRIYASAESGLYFFDKTDNSLTKLSKLNGLQEENISTLYYDPDSDQLLIGYHSGNLDVIRDHQIINLDLTATSQVSGSKRLNHITTFGGFAFLATDFGVLKFDLERMEVRETYRQLGRGAEPLLVKQTAVFHDSLFLATAEGVIAASLTENVNLLDYHNWRRYSAGIPDEQVAIIAALDDKLVAGINNDQLYIYNGEWAPTGILAGETFRSATPAGENVLLAHNNVLTEMSSALEIAAVQDILITEVNEAMRDANGKLWVADGNNGLLSNFQGAFQSYTPAGPYSNMIFRLSGNGSSIYALPGGYTLGMTPLRSDAGFYQYSKGEWSSYNVTNTGIPEFKDITDAEYRFGSLFLASAGYGLLQITENGEQIIIDETTSPLENLSSTTRNVMIPAIASGEGGLWVLNYGADHSLHFIANNASWSSFNFNFSEAKYPLDILTVGDQVWMIIDPARGGGIVVFDPVTGSSRYLTAASDNGGLPHEDVYALALDREGLIWVGTDEGIAVFPNPYGVVKGSVNATKPIYENRWLLSDEKVTAIKIDGGNRKWIGTTNGVWLFNDAADQQIINFTTENSPLPENHILDIEINDVTGEVFFATGSGIVSYRGTATASEPKHGKVKIFPNPVSMDFQGTVGISGLATDAIVKITDISGKLVWQQQANGGTATWGVADYRGNRAATGIYLVFSATPDGEDAFVGKIAVIN